MNTPTATKDNSIKTLLNREDVKARFQEMLGKRANQFLTSVLTAVQQNQNLAKADPTSVMFAAATAASLDLPVNPNLGFAYLVPYNTKQNDGSMIQMCQFQIGYKGLIQLCQRTGMFKTINAIPVYEGQITNENPLHGNQYDWSAKVSDKIIGYVAVFELINGFSRELYMTKEQVQKHASRYSKTFKSSYGVWKTNEEEMSTKTVLKLLLSKYAPMSVDFIQKALISDQAIVKDWDGEELEYPDNEPTKIDPVKVARIKEINRLQEHLDTVTDAEDLDLILVSVSEDQELSKMVQDKIDELKKEAKNV